MVAILRGCLYQKSYQEMGRLIKNGDFPEHLNNNQLPKYLFYKALYHSKSNDIKTALNLFKEVYRKIPDERISRNNDKIVIRRGLLCFKDLIYKNIIVHQLLLNENININELISN